MFYHYTDINALKSILETQKLWLTEIKYMNDYNEQLEGMRLIRKALNESKHPEKIKITSFAEQILSQYTKTGTFVGSFSTDSNKLSQWRGYTPKTGGYCLGLELPPDEMVSCIYKEEDKAASANALLELIENLYSKKHTDNETLYEIEQEIWKTISTLKNSGFIEENEFRIIQSRDLSEKTIKYRTRDNILIPYIEYNINPSTIKTIEIGPCSNAELAKNSLELFIGTLHHSKGFFQNDAPKITHSDISLRQ